MYPKVHAMERAMQRYNKELSFKDLNNIRKRIANKEYIEIGPCPQDDKLTFVYVQYNHIPYKILYTKTQKGVKIVTMYPFDVDEYNKLVDNHRIQKAINFLTERGYIVLSKEQCSEEYFNESNK